MLAYRERVRKLFVRAHPICLSTGFTAHMISIMRQEEPELNSYLESHVILNIALLFRILSLHEFPPFWEHKFLREFPHGAFPCRIAAEHLPDFRIQSLRHKKAAQTKATTSASQIPVEGPPTRILGRAGKQPKSCGLGGSTRSSSFWVMTGFLITGYNILPKKELHESLQVGLWSVS